MRTAIGVDPCLDRDGFAVIDLFNSAQIMQLRSAFDKVADRYKGGFSATMLQPDIEHRRSVHRELSRIAGDAVDREFPEYRAAYWGFAVKRSIDARAMPLHQDITLVAEGSRRGISIWAPLVDVTPANGCLEVVAGSHRLYDHPRAPGTPFPCTDLESAIRTSHLQAIPLQAGRAVILDHATFHCSPPSFDPTPRVVAAAVLAPVEQPLRYYHRVVTNGRPMLEVFEVDDDFYLRHVLGTRPEQAQPISMLYEAVPHISPDQLNQLRTH